MWLRDQLVGGERAPTIRQRLSGGRGLRGPMHRLTASVQRLGTHSTWRLVAPSGNVEGSARARGLSLGQATIWPAQS